MAKLILGTEYNTVIDPVAATILSRPYMMTFGSHTQPVDIFSANTTTPLLSHLRQRQRMWCEIVGSCHKMRTDAPGGVSTSQLCNPRQITRWLQVDGWNTPVCLLIGE